MSDADILDSQIDIPPFLEEEIKKTNVDTSVANTSSAAAPTTSGSSGGDGFDNLTYEDIQVNLRLLADLKEAEKLMIDGKYITVDQRYIQTVRRWLTADSRHRSILFIDHVINETKRYCEEIVKLIKEDVHHKENMEKLLGLQSLLNGSQTGLSRLATTYNDDKLNRARIETIQNKIKTFCDLDLKKAIN